MKIKKVQLLPILMIGGVVASCYGVISYINSSKSSFAAEKRAMITASIENIPNEFVGGGATPTLKVNLSMAERVSNGDYAAFCTYGLGRITAGPITLPDGTNIGSIGLNPDSLHKDRASIQKNLSDNTPTRLQLDRGGQDACYKITFNQNAERYEAISKLAISSTEFAQFSVGDVDYPYRIRVVDGSGAEVVHNNVMVKSIQPTQITEVKASPIGAYRLDNVNGSVTGVFSPYVEAAAGQPIPAGSIIKYSLEGSGYEFYDLKNAGLETKFGRDTFRPYAGHDRVNDSNIYVYSQMNEPRVKVVSHAGNELILQLIDEIPGGIRMLTDWNDKFSVRLTDPSKLVEGSNTLKPGDFRTTVTSGGVGGNVLYDRSEPIELQYTGQTISPGAATLRRGSVLVKYLDENGQEISPTKTIQDNQPFGTPYKDNEIQITGYTFTGLGNGSAPKQGTVNGGTQTITYTYTRQRGSVLVKYLDENGQEISPTKTIQDSQPFGTPYNAPNPDQIPGYRYTGTSQDSAPQNGTVNNGTQTVVFKFEKIQIVPKTQTINVGETPDPKSHIPNFDQDFPGCTVAYKTPVDNTKPGVVDVTLVVSCPGQDDREVETKVYILGGNDITVNLGSDPNPKDHIDGFDEKFPGCEVRYKDDIDTTKPGVIDATLVISCPGEEDKEVNVKVTVKDAPTVPQTTKVGQTPDPKSHIPNFDEIFPGCEVRYKDPVDNTKPGRVNVTLLVKCGDKEVELQSYIIFEELPPASVNAPNTGFNSNDNSILATIIAGTTTLLGAISLAVKKRF